MLGTPLPGSSGPPKRSYMGPNDLPDVLEGKSFSDQWVQLFSLSGSFFGHFDNDQPWRSNIKPHSAVSFSTTGRHWPLPITMNHKWPSSNIITSRKWELVTAMLWSKKGYVLNPLHCRGGAPCVSAMAFDKGAPKLLMLINDLSRNILELHLIGRRWLFENHWGFWLKQLPLLVNFMWSYVNKS